MEVPSVGIPIVLPERLLGQFHFLLLWKGKEGRRQTEYIGVAETEWRIDQIRKPGCCEDIVQAATEWLQVLGREVARLEGRDVDDRERREGRGHFDRLMKRTEIDVGGGAGRRSTSCRSVA